MGNTIKMGQSVLWVQENGSGTPFKPFAVGEDGASMTGKTIPVIGVTPVYGRDRYNNPIVIDITETAPGDLPSATVTIYEKKTLTFLENMVMKRCPINMQLRVVECGTLDDPFIWDKMTHWGRGVLTTYNPGDGPAIEYDNTIMQAAGTISFRHALLLSQTELSKLTTAEVNDILCIDGIPDEDCNECGTGYPGADQLLYAGCEAASGLTAKVLVSVNGGGSWVATTADPFAADEHVDFIQVMPHGRSGARVIVGTGVTDVAAEAKIAWSDVDYGAEDTTVWTDTLISSGATGDIIEAMKWVLSDRLMLASAGDIYVSSNQGNTADDAAIYTGALVINGFSISPDRKTVVAYGESNLLLREQNQNNVFAARVGPTGGSSITALAIAGDGSWYAGVDGQLWKSVNSGLNAGGWDLRYDFGGAFVVKEIQVVGGVKAGGGDAEVLKIVLDDPTPGTGEIWQTLDGAATMEQIPERANDGYNGAYFSETNDNHAIIVGDDDGATGIFHLLTPVSA